MTSPSIPKKLRIIYAEDSPPEQELLSQILSKRGHEITCFDDGRPALQALLGGSYDVLITDNDMPHMTGLDLVRELRRRNISMKIIVTSGYLKSEVEEEYRAFGVQLFLPKPSPEERIFQAVEES